jgi:hypothetical protein
MKRPFKIGEWINRPHKIAFLEVENQCFLKLFRKESIYSNEVSMRIEQVISRYGNQEYRQNDKKKAGPAFTSTARCASKGCIDMISLSEDAPPRRELYGDLISFTRMIPDEVATVWVNNAFFGDCAKDEGLLDKIIIEVF